MSTKKIIFAGIAAIALSFSARAVRAGTVREIDFNLNYLTMKATPVSGTASSFGGMNFNGALQLSTNANSTNVISVDHVAASSILSSGQFGLSNWNFSLAHGVVTAGTFSILDGLGGSYSFSVTGAVMKTAGSKKYTLKAVTNDGSFSKKVFGGVDVHDWYNHNDLDGEVLLVTFSPAMKNGSLSDDKVNVNMAVMTVVPLPSAVAAGAGLLGCLGALQWRRRVRPV